MQNKELQQQNVELGACGPYLGNSTDFFDFSSLDTGTFLLAAIDPTAENRLVHLEQGVVSGRMLQPQEDITDRTFPYIGLIHELPLLFQQHLPGQITLHATLRRVTTEQIDPRQVLQRGGFNYLAHLPGQQLLFDQNVPIVQNDPGRFANAILTWNGQRWQSSQYNDRGSILQFLYTPSSLSYQPLIGPDGKPAYTLVPSTTQNAKAALSEQPFYSGAPDPSNPDDHQGPEVFFRTLQPLVPSNLNTQYFANPVGTFNASSINAQFSNALNWLPETTYAAPPVVLRYDAQGHPLTPTTLLPTTNPAGMLLQPPLALTTLTAAAHFKGDHLISVIRVRVTGVNAPNDASWQRVEHVAQLIEQHTGLRALITLGSSPAPTLVYVPGLTPGQDGSTRTIAPLGWVEERWIALGVSLIYLGQVGQMQFVLLSALLAVCLGYLLVTLTSLLASQRRELALLSALGWRPWHPASAFLVQTLLLALGGGVGGIGLALGISWLIGASPPWLIVAWTLPIVLVLALLSALYPLWHLWRMHPAEALRAGGTVATTSSSVHRRQRQPALGTRLPVLGGMVLRNLTRSRWRAGIALGSFFLSALLLTVMLVGILAFRQSLQGTLLGTYVLVQTAVPQLAGASFAVVLTFLSVADLLLLQVRERQKEIGVLQAVGWRPQLVQRLFVQEGLTLAMLGTVPGVLVALWLVHVQQVAQSSIPAPVIAVGAVVVMAAVAGLATIPAIRAINRLPLMEVLRSE